MDWISKYRIDPNWFITSDSGHPSNNEELFELIRNHDISADHIADNRESKISEIFDEVSNDPLNWLNEYLDILHGKISMVMTLPQIISYYRTDDGKILSRNISADSIPFNNIEELKEKIDNNLDKDFYIYLIYEQDDSFTVRGKFIDKVDNKIYIKKKLV